jgi:branched-chain amino acid transport system permease protein
MSVLGYVTQQFINGLSLGSIYALLAIGLAMVFGILRLINFAHGDLMMVSSFAALGLITLGLPFPLVAIGAIVVAAIAGVTMERLAYRPVRGSPDVVLLLTSFAVTMILENMFVMTVSAQPRNFPVPSYLSQLFWLDGIGLPNVVLSSVNLTTICTAIVALILLTWFVKYTKVGTAMRATAEDLTAAQLMGININVVIMWAFIVGSAMAGVAGVLWGARIGKIDPLMGFLPVLKAFTAAVIGGFGSIPGAVVGGYVLGFGEVFLVGFLPQDLTGYRDAFVFLILIIVLLFRPNGILGSTEREKV